MKNIIIFLLLLTLSLSRPHFNSNFQNNNYRNNNGNGFRNNFNNFNNNNNNFFIGGEEIKNTKTETQEEPNKRIPSSYMRKPLPQENEYQQVDEASYEQQLLSTTIPQKFGPTKYGNKPHKLHEKRMGPKLKFQNEPFNPYGPKSKFFGRREKFIPLIPKIDFENNYLSPEQVQNKIFPITEELKNLADTPEQKIPPQQFDRFYEILNKYPDLEPISQQIQNLNKVPLNQMNEEYISDSVKKINELKNDISDKIKESNEKNEETNENIVKSVVDELNKIIDNEIVDKNQILKNYENIIQIVNNDILENIVKSYEKINNVDGDYVPISLVQETINELSLNIK